MFQRIDDDHVIQQFARVLERETEGALLCMEVNLDPERLALLRIIRMAAAQVWPEAFATRREMDMIQAKLEEGEPRDGFQSGCPEGG